MKKIYFLYISVILLSACSKAVKDCEGLAAPIVTSNSPVVAGGSLQLIVSGADDVYMYNWYGPNYFYSREQNPQIDNITSLGSGYYYVDVITNGGCIYTVHSDSIQIGGAAIACDMPANTASLQSSPISVYASAGKADYYIYSITANGIGADVHLEFNLQHQNGALASGVYTPVASSPNDLGDYGQVLVQMTTGGGLWVGKSGTVYVSVTNGKATVTFCNLVFSSYIAGGTATGSLNLTER